MRLPQYNWGAPEVQDYAERIIRFWMDTGIDGMIIDAVNWYLDYTWGLGRKRVTGVIDSYGNTYSQPEGAGGFHEDPAAWITEGNWRSAQDYGLGIWWEKGTDVIATACETRDPRPIERALRDYRDRVVAAGSVLYFTHFEGGDQSDVSRKRLTTATAVGIGELQALSRGGDREVQADDEARTLFAMKRAHPALHNLSTRRMLPVADRTGTGPSSKPPATVRNACWSFSTTGQVRRRSASTRLVRTSAAYATSAQGRFFRQDPLSHAISPPSATHFWRSRSGTRLGTLRHCRRQSMAGA